MKLAGAALLGGLLVLVACRGQIALGGDADSGTSSSGGSSGGISSSSGGTSSGSSSGGSPSSVSSSACPSVVATEEAGAPGASWPLPGLDAGETVVELTDAQADQLCQWLEGLWPGGSDGPCGIPQVGGAFVGGAMKIVDLPGPYDPAMSITFICLDSTDCVLNLRQAPCEGTLGALFQCVNAFEANSGNTYDAVEKICSPWESAPACCSTVISNDPKDCAFTLPIAPNAICPDAG